MTINDIKKYVLENSYVTLSVKRWKHNKNGVFSAIFGDISEKEYKEEIEPFFMEFKKYGYIIYTKIESPNTLSFYVTKDNIPFEKKPIKLGE